MRSFLAVLIILMFATYNQNISTKGVKVKVDVSKIEYTMKGGMGASWHAISSDFPLNNEKYTIPVREEGPRGSAFGGNPPTENSNAWKQLEEYASWLGMNFIRVELSQRMYEPEKQQFDWHNEEMKALYKILDWAEGNDADVFLQQMWMGVEWNAIPGIHPLISAPRNLDDFANSIATLIEYLLNEKGYTCIKYFCMTNEPPGGTWGSWWEYGDTKGDIADAWARLRKEFDDRKIHIPISGPDWTDLPPFDEGKLGMAKSFGSIDIHSYHGITDEGEENLRKWAEWSHAQGKPFFLTEYGNMNLGWGGNDPHQKSFEAALSNASDVLRGLHAGVDGFNKWSYTNRGDLDGQWQLVRTYDLESRTYLSKVDPEPEAYYGFGIISRFLSKYSSVVSCTTDHFDMNILSAALLSPEDELSIILVNMEEQAVTIDLELASYEKKSMQLYQVTKETVNLPGFKLNAIDKFDSHHSEKVVLPAKSITNISSLALNNNDKGIIK